MRDCIDVMGQALGALARGESMLPLRTVLSSRAARTSSPSMPAYVGISGTAIGAKVITVFPGNHGTALDSHQGAVLLFDATTARSAPCSTRRRSRRSAPRPSRRWRRARSRATSADDLAILGSGVQARTHLEAIALVRPMRSSASGAATARGPRALRLPGHDPARRQSRSAAVPRSRARRRDRLHHHGLGRAGARGRMACRRRARQRRRREHRERRASSTARRSPAPRCSSTAASRR